jgi:hypothetical protein
MSSAEGPLSLVFSPPSDVARCEPDAWSSYVSLWIKDLEPGTKD